MNETLKLLIFSYLTEDTAWPQTGELGNWLKIRELVDWRIGKLGYWKIS